MTTSPDSDADPNSGPTVDRSIELDIVVSGTVEQVWNAIATGPGISSWYVPHTVEEREGGTALASFGPEPEMQIPGRVAAWEPPHRVVFDSGGADEGLAFEWLVEARDEGTCIVRLVNTGFGSGDEWDAQYDGMSEGWHLFLTNLQLHLEHFGGQRGTSMLPGGMWPGPQAAAWARLLDELGIAADVSVGDRVAVSGDTHPSLAGTVASVDTWRLAFLIDEPAPGTAFLAAEGHGDEIGISVWMYLYGDDAGTIVERDLPRWQGWLGALAAG